MEKRKIESLILSAHEQMRRVDCKYDTIDFDSYPASVAYFDELGTPLSLIVLPPSKITPFRENISSLEIDAKRREVAHTLMREAALNVHGILANSTGEDAVQTVGDIARVLNIALEGMRDLMDDMREEFRMLIRKQMAAKDSERDSGKNPEMLS
ncbi:hypothetical protein B0H19DRAFT_1130776 [Mycena capillaripes]|nr:hypothetical protein B0H19DRAFT_1130776 [Mycena capillaripes]